MISWIIHVANDLRLTIKVKELSILIYDYAINYSQMTNAMSQLSGMVAFLIACKVYGEDQNINYQNLLDVFNNCFTEEDLLSEELRVSKLICNIELYSLTPSNICEELLSNPLLGHIPIQEAVNFVGNLCMYY